MAEKLPAVVPCNVRVVLPLPVAKLVALSVAVTDGLETVTVKATGALKLSAVTVTVEVAEPVVGKATFVGRAAIRKSPAGLLCTLRVLEPVEPGGKETGDGLAEIVKLPNLTGTTTVCVVPDTTTLTVAE